MNIQVEWNLDDIVKPGEFDQILADCEAAIGEYEQWFEKLQPDMSEADFKAYQAFSEATGKRLTRLMDRPELEESVDQNNESAKTQKARVKDLALKMAETTRKIGFWFQGLPVESAPDKPPLDDKNAKRLFASIPELEYSLNYMRAAAKHSLLEREENIIDNKDASGVGVLTDLREVIAAEQTFTVKFTGQKPKLYETEAEVRTLMYDPDAAVRRAAYESVLDVYKRNQTKYFMIYQAVVKDWGFETRLRGYSSPIGMRNFGNHVPDRAIEVLMDVCEQNVGTFQDYFRFKARELGLNKLTRYDVYAPLESAKVEYPLEQAVELVLQTYAEFSPQFAKYARRIIDDHHVDFLPRAGKQGGAFCATIVPDLSPYVLLNYTRTLNDVSTIAHELGHGVHALFASHLPASAQHPSLPLAETASTFGENVLFEKLLSEAGDDQTRKAMLSDKINDSYAAIARQNFIVKAEIMAHDQMSQGLSPTGMGEIWLETLHQLFGDSVDVDPSFAYEWAYIPHIVRSPFYCYAYNFGELLSLALYARYKQEGQEFVAKIEQILAAGGSRDPQAVLNEVGIDMSDANFWQGSFQILRDWMAALQKLATK